MALVPAPITVPPSPLSFVDLAPEMRLTIYKQLFKRSDTINLIINEQGNVEHDRGDNLHDKLLVQLLATHSTIYQEGAPILYEGNKFIIDWNTFGGIGRGTQHVSDFLLVIDIDCADGEVWSFVKPIKDLVKLIPGLKKIGLKFKHASRLLAAGVELSTALTPCAPMLEGPALELCLSILKDDELARNGRSYEDLFQSEIEEIHATLRAPGAKLQDIADDYDLGNNVITKFHSSNLLAISLTGPMSPSWIDIIEEHKCKPKGCAFIKILVEESKENEDDTFSRKRIHYKWKRIQDTERNPQEKPLTHHWRPKLPLKDLQRLKECFGEAAFVYPGSDDGQSETTSGSDSDEAEEGENASEHEDNADEDAGDDAGTGDGGEDGELDGLSGGFEEL